VRIPDAERKQVTVLFADVAHSMDLAERFDAEQWTQIITGLFEAGAEAVRRYGGTVDKFTGDGLMALFGAPIAQEDHAARAAHAALALLSAAADYAAKARSEHAVELHVRVGLNSGEVVAGDVGDSGFTAVGHTVGLAQRMESLADPGTVMLSEHTAALLSGRFDVRDLGRVGVKGAVAPVGTFALGAATALSPGGRPRTGSARLVGRDAELATLEAALSGAQEGRAQVIGIVGEAGAGKSRLCDELARRAGELGVIVRRAAGVAHATSVPLLPILQWFRDYFAITDADSPADIRERIRARLLALDAGFEPDLGLLFDFLEIPDPDLPRTQLSPEARRRQIVDLIRRVTARRSELHTLLLILEDLHWFDPQSVEFLEAWLPSFPGTRTLIVTNFRPEFQAPWARYSYYRQIPLSPLDSGAVDELLGELLGPDASLNHLSAQLRQRTGGNPFFAEEIVRSLAGDGTLVGAPGAYGLGKAITEIRVPPTVQAVLAGRIDRLDWRNKTVLQTAAVLGRTFAEPILATVTGLASADLADALRVLCVEEMLQQAPDPGEYRFWHPLTQEVAYGTLLAATRRRHHVGVAQALIDSAPTRHDQLAAVIATHFEAAGDDLEAARWQIRAGVNALRTDVAEAQRRWRSALEHLASVPESADAMALGARTRYFLVRNGGRSGAMEPAEAARLFAEARPMAERLNDPALLMGLFIAEGSVHIYAGDTAASRRSWLEGRRLADESGQTGLRAFGNATVGVATSYTGSLAEARRAVEQALDLCAGDPLTGVVEAGYSVFDFAHWASVIISVPAGRLAEARKLARLTVALYDQRPVVEWRSWTLTMLTQLADASGEPRDLDDAEPAATEALRAIQDSGNIDGTVRALQAIAIIALLRGNLDLAADTVEEALGLVEKHRRRLEHPRLLANAARIHLARNDVKAARASAEEAVAVANFQGSHVVECFARAVQCRVWRESATGAADVDVARLALEAGERLAAELGADTYAAFLAEERARLNGGDLAAAAAAYDAIGATGHAARIRRELAG
jgi:adenylate cyclase